MMALDKELLVTVVVVEAMVLALSLSIMFGHAAWFRFQEVRCAQRMIAVRTMFARALSGGSLLDDEVAVVKSLPLSRQAQVVSECGRNLSGQGLSALGAVGVTIGMVSAAERMCRSWRWARRLQGVRMLTVLSAGATVVPRLLHDRSPVVRSEAAYWSASHPSPATVAALLGMLSDPDQGCRFAAMDVLQRMGEAAVGPLIQLVATESGAPVDAAMIVISNKEHQDFLPVAVAMVVSESAVARASAAKVLGLIGSAQHTGLLQARLADSTALVREAAVHAIGALRHWPLGPQVAGLLADSDWTVRRAAGLALRALGAPGHLLLRRALKGPDRYAVDMARHVLGLPADELIAKAS